MDLLASYDDENTSENNASRSPSVVPDTGQATMKSNMLENEWLSFEQMIAPGGVSGNTDPVKASDFLVDGVVAYPGMQKSVSQSGITDVIKSSPSSSENGKDDEIANPSEQAENGVIGEGATADDDDAFFKLRKRVKERDRSSSSDRSSGSDSSSDDDVDDKEDDDDKEDGEAGSSRSPSPPHLSPVTSIKSHDNEPPPDITTESDNKHTEPTEHKPEAPEIAASISGKVEERRKSRSHRSKSRDRRRSRSRDRKHSHRSRHHGSSKSKRRRSKSRDRKRRSRDRHRRKDRKSSRDETKSRDRKDSSKSESKDHESGSKSDSHRDKTENKSDRKRNRSRSHSRDRKDRKKDRKHSHRSRSRERKRSRSKDRKGKDSKRSRSKERRRSKSKDRKRRHRSKSRERRSHSRQRYSRSRSRERLRSRSPVMARKLTFKEQMRQEFIQASKEMEKNKEKGEHSQLQLPLKRPGEPLKPADLLKGVKLGSGGSGGGGDTVTPQMALMQTMEAMHKKAQELTGVEVPKYYNPAAVNPLKYAEQVQKRKLLWSKKTEEKDKNEQIETQWKSAFATDNDDKTASKFLKLMGMKDGGSANATKPETSEEFQKLTEEQHRKQTELFQRLDQEYAFARMTTHTQRGVGLGFATTVIDPNRPPTTTT